MSKFMKLGKLADLTVGFVGTMAEHYSDNGIPFLRSLNIKPYEISGDDLKYITEEFNNKISKSVLHERDVVIVRTGVPGTCCVVPKEYDGCNCSDVVIVRPNEELINPHYLATYINVWGQKQISNNKVGAVQKHFNVHSAEEMLIYIPERDEQEKIARLVVAINEQIKNNNTINDNLQQRLKMLYDYWFTQFDFPDENGRPFKSSGGAMTWNDKLKTDIPVSFSATPLSAILIFLSGYSFSSEDYVDVDKYKLITIKNVQDNGINLNVDNYIEKIPSGMPDYCLLSPGDILMSLTGNVGRIGVMYDYNCLLNQRVALIQPDKTELRPYIYFLLKSDIIRKKFESIAGGSSQANLSPVEAAETIIAYNEEIAVKYAKNAAPIFKNLIHNLCENQELENLRDWLLPMLMNGQATVSN